MRFQFNPRPGARPAFTLVELMISIALVLLLMLGINQVFKVTGEAVGTNAAISTGVRDARAAQNAFGRDIAAWAADAPAIILRSERVSAFRNRADAQSDRDYVSTASAANIDLAKRTTDIDGDGIEGNSVGEITPRAIYNHRSHRIDMLSFFARGLFRRQTGGAVPAAGIYSEEYVADMSSAEAWLWYGHIKRPDYTSTASPLNILEEYVYRNPGEDPNPSAGPPVNNANNFYATDWVLGRMAVLLVRGQDTGTDGIGDIILDRRGREQRFITRTLPLTNDSVHPLADDARSNDQGGAAQRWQLRSGRYDLAGTDFAQFKQILEENISPPPPPPDGRWWVRMGFRFQGDPTPLRPITPNSAARTTPVFLQNCSQFIVEYAGDFIEQSQDLSNGAPAGQIRDVNGDGIVYQPDGHIDFIVVNPGTPNESRRIRWYGMPRDVASPGGGPPDGRIISSLSASGNTNALVDVVPLQDVLDTAPGGFSYMAPFGSPNNTFIERLLPRSVEEWPFSPPPAFYADVNTPNAGLALDRKYTAAWGPDTSDQPRPQMIRIVITLDDPEGRIADGQTFEYVFRIGG